MREKELRAIEKDVNLLKKKLLEKRPSPFSKRDIINAFFGALLIGLTFSVKGALIRTAEGLNLTHVILIVVSTLLILVGEIYFIGYSRVPDKWRRKPGQFIMKRLTTLYFIAILVSIYLVYIFGIYNQLENGLYDVFKLVILMSMPCAIGAAVPSLMKQF